MTDVTVTVRALSLTMALRCVPGVWVVGGSFGDQRPSANSARGAESWFSGSVYFCQSSQPSTAHRPLIRLQAQAARTAEKTWRLWCPLNRCLVYLKAFRWEPRRFHGGARPPPHGNSCQTGICVIPKTRVIFQLVPLPFSDFISDFTLNTFSS